MDTKNITKALRFAVISIDHVGVRRTESRHSTRALADRALARAVSASSSMNSISYLPRRSFEVVEIA